MKRNKRDVSLDDLRQLFGGRAEKAAEVAEATELELPPIQDENECQKTEATGEEVVDAQVTMDESIAALRAGREAVLEEFRQHVSGADVPDDHPVNLVRAGRQAVSAIHAELLRRTKDRSSSNLYAPPDETFSAVVKELRTLNQALDRTLDEIIAEAGHTEPRLILIRLRSALQDYLRNAVRIYDISINFWEKER